MEEGEDNWKERWEEKQKIINKRIIEIKKSKEETKKQHLEEIDKRQSDAKKRRKEQGTETETEIKKAKEKEMENAKWKEKEKEKESSCEHFLRTEGFYKEWKDQKMKTSLSFTKVNNSNGIILGSIKNSTKTDFNSNMSKYKQREAKTMGDVDSNLKTIPCNVNEFKHLLFNNQLNSFDLTWTLQLRDGDKWRNKKNNDSSGHPPGFYTDDENKTKSRKNLKDLTDIITPFYKTENTFKLSHLVENSKQANTHQIYFGSSLRNFNLKNPLPEINKNNKWKNLPYYPKDRSQGCINQPVTEKGINSLKKLDDKTWRAYNLTLTKDQYGANKIIKRRLDKDKIHTLPFLGEHLSMGKYSQNYGKGAENIQSYRHIYFNQSNSTAMYETSLRSPPKKEITEQDILKMVNDRREKEKKQKEKFGKDRIDKETKNRIPGYAVCKREKYRIKK